MKYRQLFLSLCANAVLVSTALAEDFPIRPVKLMVTVSAGGGADTVARLLGSKLSAVWNQPTVIENRVGATGMIGAEAVAKSPADGHTVLFASATFVQAPALFPNAPYRLDDFAAISQVTSLAVVLVVGANSPFKTLEDYLTAARRGGKVVSYGSIGLGSTLHIFGEILAKDGGAPLAHVPYRGEAPAINDTVAGHLDSSFISIASGLPLIASGKLRPLAVVGKTRAAVLPDVPSFGELGFPRLDIHGWYGVLAPAATPKPVISKFSAAVASIMQQNDIASTIRDGGNLPVGSTPDEFGAVVRADFAKWNQLIQELNIKPTP